MVPSNKEDEVLSSDEDNLSESYLRESKSYVEIPEDFGVSG